MSIERLSASGDIYLRPVLPTDLTHYFNHQLDTEACRLAAFPSRSCDAFMAHWSAILADDTVIARTVLLDDEVAGNSVSWEADGCRLVGYWIGREHWGRGVATRALAEFLRFVTERPLYAYVATTNAASIRVLEKNGFRRAVEHPAADVDDPQELLFTLAPEQNG